MTYESDKVARALEIHPSDLPCLVLMMIQSQNFTCDGGRRLYFETETNGRRFCASTIVGLIRMS
jgi:hypothetical protein